MAVNGMNNQQQGSLLNNDCCNKRHASTTRSTCICFDYKHHLGKSGRTNVAPIESCSLLVVKICIPSPIKSQHRYVTNKPEKLTFTVSSHYLLYCKVRCISKCILYIQKMKYIVKDGGQRSISLMRTHYFNILTRLNIMIFCLPPPSLS